MYPHSTSYHHRPHPRSSYLLPFLSIIILGLIVVLVFQMVDYFQEKRIRALENKASVAVVAGRAEMKIWGVDQWTSALDGSILNEGDMIRTVPGSRIILTLLNGNVIRLHGDTEVELTALKSRDSQDEASFLLKSGDLWLKRTEKETVRSAFKVETSHLEVTSIGTIFHVSSGSRESVRVLDGKVSVAVKVLDTESNRKRIAETLEVALGQEVSLSATDINDLQNKKPLQLLALLSDDFRESEWYKWNREQDASGQVGVTVADAVEKKEGAPLLLPPPSVEPPPHEVTAVLSAPEILTPLVTERTTKSGNVLITGTVSSATEKIEMTTYIAGKAESYVLQKYKAGSEPWTYVASREYGNLVPGENRFTVVAVGKDGAQSDATEFTIFYDKPKEPADLAAPVVVSFNDTSSSETMEDSVKVSGTIGKGIVKIFVNDFALTRYVPDSGVWVYYAKTVYGNLKEGENEYSVYGMDYDGNKTPVVKFTIVKKPKTEPTPAPAPIGEPVL